MVTYMVTNLPIYGSIFRYLKMGKWVSGGKNCSLVTNALFGSKLKFDFDITDRLSGMGPIDASVFIKFKYYLKLTNIWPQGSIQKRSVAQLIIKKECYFQLIVSHLFCEGIILA